MPYKHNYDTILTRLTVILSRLNDGEALSVTELAKEFNVSERTIQRDLNERLISFPIYQEKKKWKMQEGYRLEKSTSIEDAVVLDIMEKLIEGAGRKFSMKAERLLSKIKNQSFNLFYVITPPSKYLYVLPEGCSAFAYTLRWIFLNSLRRVL